MWHRKWLNRLNHWMSMRESKDPTSYVYLRGRLECLDPKLLKRIPVVSACVTQIEVGLPSVAEYVRFFQLLNASDLHADKIDLESIKYRRQTVTIETFFRDSRGRQLPSEELVRKYREEAMTLLDKYQAVRAEQIGVAGFNVRLLNHLLPAVAKLADDLRLYSL